MSFMSDLANFVASRSGLVQVLTNDEYRAESLMSTVASKLGFTFLVWSVTRGVYRWNSKTNERKDLGNPVKLAEFLANFEEGPALLCMEDPSSYLTNPQVARALKDVARRNKGAKPSETVAVVLLDNKRIDAVPTICMDLPLPDRDEIRALLDKVRSAVKDPAALADLEGDRLEAAIDVLSGLEAEQIARAAAQSLAKFKRIDLGALAGAKKAIISDSAALEWIDPDPRGLYAVGGLAPLKSYLVKRRKAFSKARRGSKLPRPKGILAAGLPGTGKSLTAKAISAAWGLPLLRLDVGAAFGKFVGDSEAGMRKALRVAEACAPCIVWIDEIEKALAGSGGAGDSDGGTTKRVFGTVLTWIQECKAPVYIVATSNDPTALPAELFRAGRFDSLWWVDVPNAKDRAEVVQVVCKKYDLDGTLDVDALVNATKDFTGSEIEQSIIEAIWAADDEDRMPTTADALAAAKQIRPVLQGWGEIGLLKKVRDWASQAARPAGDPEDQTVRTEAEGFGEVLAFDPSTSFDDN